MPFFKFIPSMKTGVVQTFGKYTRLASPGLIFYLPFIQTITVVSNQLTQN
jgi:regulator of protease activity HflC (stomatin/prohibitin superfamily)